MDAAVEGAGHRGPSLIYAPPPNATRAGPPSGPKSKNAKKPAQIKRKRSPPDDEPSPPTSVEEVIEAYNNDTFGELLLRGVDVYYAKGPDMAHGGINIRMEEWVTSCVPEAYHKDVGTHIGRCASRLYRQMAKRAD